MTANRPPSPQRARASSPARRGGPARRRTDPALPDGAQPSDTGLLGPVEVRAISGALGIRPTKALGQNFVHDAGTVRRIVAAAGPMPSTPGHAETEAATAAQRHAMDMLAQSDRAGCANGAAIALAMDWAVIRETLDAAAERLGLTPPPSQLPLAEETVTVVDTLVREGVLERAMLFGAQQLFAQHRGLWDLLEARASARDKQ